MREIKSKLLSVYNPDTGKYEQIDALQGNKGTSVTIDSIIESSEDGGNNVVAFSDGNTLTVKNGSKGSDADATEQIVAHNTSTEAHNDIRELIIGLTTRLNTLADSEDITLDQMSELVAYIKSNKSLIDSITTDKVNVSDIIDNLTTNVTNKPLSAAQGVALKALIDAIKVPTNVSAFENDAGYLTEVPEEYITETELENKGFLTQHQDLSDYLKKDNLDDSIQKIADSEIDEICNSLIIAVEEVRF